MSLLAEKTALRRSLAKLGRRMDRTQRDSLSATARDLIQRQSAWQQARTVLFYWPLPDELDLWALARTAMLAGKAVGLPRHNPAVDEYEPRAVRSLEDDLMAGKYGIPEPKESCALLLLKRLDLILVPGVAFDRHGRRLGRGKGYYDRLLRNLSGIKCGVAFDEQVISEVPVAAHDKYVNCILTPTRWLVFERPVLE
jgi:5-formyltetrahydrofolate cyclo-ligase